MLNNPDFQPFLKPDKEVLGALMEQDLRLCYLPAPQQVIWESKRLLEKTVVDGEAIFNLMINPLQTLLADMDFDFPVIIHGGSCSLDTQTVIIYGEELTNRGIADVLLEGKEGSGKTFYGYAIYSFNEIGHDILTELTVVLGKARQHSRSFRTAEKIAEVPYDWSSFPLVLVYDRNTVIREDPGATKVFNGSLLEGRESDAVLAAIILDYPNF